MASRTDPVQFVRQVAAGSASRAQHSAVQAARVAAARRAAARHRATLAAATREEEAAQRREDDRLASVALGRSPESRSDDDIAQIWRWLRRRKSIRKWFFPDQQKATDATNQFCRHVQLVQVPSNTLIYAQEDAAASVFAVVGGAVELLRQEAPAVDTRQPPRGRGTSAKAATVGNRRDSVLGIVPIPVVPELRLGNSNAAPASAADSASGGVLRTTSVGATLWGKTASLGSMGPLIAESQAPGAGAAKPTLPGTSEAAANAGAASAGDVVDAAAAGLGESAALLRPGDVFGQPLPTFHAMSQQFEPAFAHGTADNSAVRRRGESAVSRPSGAHSHASHRHSKPGRQTTLLRVPAQQYAATPVGEAYLRAEARRLNHLSKLVVFRGWPVAELEFLARWMQDVKLAPGDAAFNVGDDVKRVWFLLQGCVTVALPTPDNASPVHPDSVPPSSRHVPAGMIAAEHVFAPNMFGFEDVLRKQHRDRKAAAAESKAAAISAAAAEQAAASGMVPVADEPKSSAAAAAAAQSARFSTAAIALQESHCAVLPVEVWHRIVGASKELYKRHTRRRVRTFKADRGVWYDVRRESNADVQRVAYDFMLPVQVAWISCGVCGGKSHTSDMCPELSTITSARQGYAGVVGGGASAAPVNSDAPGSLGNNKRPRPPGSRGVLINDRLEFAKGTPVSSQLYQMGQALMKRTMQEAATTGEDWNLALRVRRKRWAHRAIRGVMSGLAVIRRWLGVWRERRARQAVAAEAERQRVQAALNAMANAPKESVAANALPASSLWRGRIDMLRAESGPQSPVPTSPASSIAYSSPVEGGNLGRWVDNTTRSRPASPPPPGKAQHGALDASQPPRVESPHSMRRGALAFEAIPSPRRGSGRAAASAAAPPRGQRPATVHAARRTRGGNAGTAPPVGGGANAGRALGSGRHLNHTKSSRQRVQTSHGRRPAAGKGLRRTQSLRAGGGPSHTTKLRRFSTDQSAIRRHADAGIGAAGRFKRGASMRVRGGKASRAWGLRPSQQSSAGLPSVFHKGTAGPETEAPPRVPLDLSGMTGDNGSEPATPRTLVARHKEVMKRLAASQLHMPRMSAAARRLQRRRRKAPVPMQGKGQGKGGRRHSAMARSEGAAQRPGVPRKPQLKLGGPPPPVSGVVERALAAAQKLENSPTTRQVLRDEEREQRLLHAMKRRGSANLQHFAAVSRRFGPGSIFAGTGDDDGQAQPDDVVGFGVAGERADNLDSHADAAAAAVAGSDTMGEPSGSVAAVVAAARVGGRHTHQAHLWLDDANGNNAVGFNHLSNANMHVNLISSQQPVYGTKLRTTLAGTDATDAQPQTLDARPTVAAYGDGEGAPSPGVQAVQAVAQTPPSPPARRRPRPRRRFTLMNATNERVNKRASAHAAKAGSAVATKIDSSGAVPSPGGFGMNDPPALPGSPFQPHASPIKENEMPLSMAQPPLLRA